MFVNAYTKACKELKRLQVNHNTGDDGKDKTWHGKTKNEVLQLQEDQKIPHLQTHRQNQEKNGSDKKEKVWDLLLLTIQRMGEIQKENHSSHKTQHEKNGGKVQQK